MEQRVLGGRYLLKDKVGTGGMATVFRAQDQVLDRTVAVKIMLPQYAGDATFAARFKQEAQAAAGLSSPYIVGVYDWGKDGDTYYIVMEYLRGTDLKSGIKSHGALDPKKVAQIGSQISSALSVAHKHEIIHRDIKPQNIMVLPDGNIKVMDFGIARAKNSHLTQDNNVLGKDQETAIELIKEAGLEVGTVDQSYNDDVDEGKVAEQTPNGNTKKPKGSKVNLVISKGPKPSEKVEVPQLVGLTKDQAEAALASVGLKGNATEEANEADEGQVFEQGTDAGKEVEKGTTISYKVSSGPDTTSVPDLTDMTEAQARNALDMAGFGVDVSYQENDSVTEGTVISWNPSGKQKPGATITVVIAKKSGKASVPGNLYGKSISAAVTALNNAGFYNIAFCDQNGNPVSGNENATVTGVSPTGKQSTDSTITLTVSLSGSASGDDSDTTTN